MTIVRLKPRHVLDAINPATCQYAFYHTVYDALDNCHVSPIGGVVRRAVHPGTSTAYASHIANYVTRGNSLVAVDRSLTYSEFYQQSVADIRNGVNPLLMIERVWRSLWRLWHDDVSRNRAADRFHHFLTNHVLECCRSLHVDILMAAPRYADEVIG